MKKKNKYRHFLLLTILIAGAFLSFAYFKNKNEPADMENKLTIATSFYPLYFFATEIGGDFVQVKNITPRGRSPHEYDITAKDLLEIRKSELLILNGGGLEVWEQKVRENIISKNSNILVLKERLESNEKVSEKILKDDPHFWLSPTLAVAMADSIAIEIIKNDLPNRHYYESNLNILKTKLLNLDSSLGRGLRDCPQRDFITSHKVFGYLAQDYDLNQISIAGFSPNEEPSPRQLTEFSEIVREKGIKYILFEKTDDSRFSQVLAGESGAQILEINPMERLSLEEMTRGKNYITVMEENLKNLKTALECENIQQL